jgi:hypothetical protein
MKEDMPTLDKCLCLINSKLTHAHKTFVLTTLLARVKYVTLLQIILQYATLLLRFIDLYTQCPFSIMVVIVPFNKQQTKHQVYRTAIILKDTSKIKLTD